MLSLRAWCVPLSLAITLMHAVLSVNHVCFCDLFAVCVCRGLSALCVCVCVCVCVCRRTDRVSGRGTASVAGREVADAVRSADGLEAADVAATVAVTLVHQTCLDVSREPRLTGRPAGHTGSRQVTSGQVRSGQAWSGDTRYGQTGGSASQDSNKGGTVM